MTLYKRREKFAKLSEKTGAAFSKLPLSPNQWTLISLVPALLGFFSAYMKNFPLALVFFALTSFFDIIDGGVARATNRSTILGAYIDTIIDRYIEFLMIASLLFLGLPEVIIPTYAWIILFVFGAFLSTYAKSASAEKEILKKGGHGVKGGILEHPDRLIGVTAIFLLSLFITHVYLSYLLIALAILSNVSAVQRISSAVKIERTKVNIQK